MNLISQLSKQIQYPKASMLSVAFAVSFTLIVMFIFPDQPVQSKSGLTQLAEKMLEKYRVEISILALSVTWGSLFGWLGLQHLMNRIKC